MAALERELRDRKTGAARDRDVAYPSEHVSFDRIDEVVAREYGTTVEALRGHGHGKGAGTAKVAALELACRLSGLTQREIGTHYGGISSQAVSIARKRGRSLMPAADVLRLADGVRAGG